MPSKKNVIQMHPSSSIRFSSESPLSEEGLSLDQQICKAMASACLIQFVSMTPRIKHRLNIEVRR